MAPRKSILNCKTCGRDLPREMFENRYKPNGGLRGKKPFCIDCAGVHDAMARARAEAAYLPNPSGLCMCGCGATVPRAKINRPSRGWVKGEYTRFLTGHCNSTSPVEYLVDGETGCWVWQRGTDGHGYGAKYNGDGMEKAHRVYYAQTKGEIPDGWDLHHICENRLCVNPDHLQPLPREEHMKIDGRSTYRHPSKSRYANTER